MTNLYNDENITFHKIQKQNLILLPETHTIYYKELHTAKGLNFFTDKILKRRFPRKSGTCWIRVRAKSGLGWNKDLGDFRLG